MPTQRKTFAWAPDVGNDKDIEPKIHSAQFGDGYEQRASLGINLNPETWNITITGTNDELDAIDAFLKSCGGVESFYWQTPRGRTALFVCKKWNIKGITREIRQFSAAFEERPA